MMLKAQDVESLCARQFWGKFPYKDCYKLQKLKPRITHGLIPDLDLYLAFIAGYSSSATRLAERPREEIRKAIPKLKLSFFEKHPVYKPLKKLINARDTPSLSKYLRVANESDGIWFR